MPDVSRPIPKLPEPWGALVQWLANLGSGAIGGALVVLVLYGPPEIEGTWGHSLKERRQAVDQRLDQIETRTQGLDDRLATMQPAALEKRVRFLEEEKIRIETTLNSGLANLHEKVEKLDATIDTVNRNLIEWLRE